MCMDMSACPFVCACMFASLVKTVVMVHVFRQPVLWCSSMAIDVCELLYIVCTVAVLSVGNLEG